MSKKLVYRGSPKHKKRPASGPKGTLCPEWTHSTPNGGLAVRVQAHDWSATLASDLFDIAETNRRYATAKGIVFEAKPTSDGTWHGFPVPWESVPRPIIDKWLKDKLVSRSEIKRFFKFDKSDIHWALGSD